MEPHSVTDQKKARGHGRAWGKIALILLVLLAVAGAFLANHGALPFQGSSSVGKGAVKYHCPMHPTVVSDKKGSCPICGMDLVPMTTEDQGSSATTKSVQAVKYHCPMHPTVVSDKKGSCPICGMDLVPLDNADTKAKGVPPTKKIIYRSTMNPGEVSDKPGKDSMGMEMVAVEVAESGGSMPAGLATVAITPAARERMGLTLGMVEKRHLVRETRTAARIVPDETRLYHVTVKVEGYVKELFTATTGQYVKQGEPLLSIYSPTLVATEQEYLNALRANNAELAAAARTRLSLWDIADKQIERLTQTGTVETTVTLWAPTSGWILERDIAAGHKVMAGEQLLVLCDLSNIWADSDIYQTDLPLVVLGMPVDLTVSAAPGKTFTGKVNFISPALDPETRTVKVRMDVPNAELLLKPEMYAVARLQFELGEKLAIPESAVMLSGEHAYAFRDAGDGRLVPTKVRLGARGDGWYELVDGLNEGDKVVTSANFLVDSESSMKAAVEALTEK